MSWRDQISTMGQWASSRAWSRAGAVAQALAVGRPRRVVAGASRVVLFAVGTLLISSSVAVMLWTGLGPGPLDVFIGGVREQTGLPLTLAVWVTIAAMLAVAWGLGRRPGLGSIVSPIVIGPMMQLTLELLQRFDVPSSFAVRVLLHASAVIVVGIGAGALIVSNLGAGSGELLAAAASDRSGHPEPRVRFGFEMALLVLGVLLGGPIGVGTVIVAALIGPSVAFGLRSVGSVATASRRQLDLVAT